MPMTTWFRIRHDHYEPLLPEVDTEFRELDSRLRLRREQHKMLVRRRDDLLTTPRPEFLATPEEQRISRDRSHRGGSGRDSAGTVAGPSEPA